MCTPYHSFGFFSLDQLLTVRKCHRDISGRLPGRLCSDASTNFLRFFRAGKLLATAGTAADGDICLYDLSSETPLLKQPVQAEVQALSFLDSVTLISVGREHFKARSAMQTR